MYSTTALVFWALITLISGFLAGLLAGVFGGKDKSPKAKEIITSIKVDWQNIEEHVEKRINELTHDWLTEQKEPATEEAQIVASKKALTYPQENQMSESLYDSNTTAAVQPATTATDKTDAVLAKVKELLKVAGHDVDTVFDDVVALAKNLA
ncbi:hypothetical protein [Pantoea ananatis]|uniref:hypothetical protein n=1 Tax=Pantoea ananas TaxID=553 RepID=UPI001B30B6CD|nr:hypothetical protein [Pantoea ananatis]